jgi:hypothetical protein
MVVLSLLVPGGDAGRMNGVHVESRMHLNPDGDPTADVALTDPVSSLSDFLLQEGTFF